MLVIGQLTRHACVHGPKASFVLTVVMHFMELTVVFL